MTANEAMQSTLDERRQSASQKKRLEDYTFDTSCLRERIEETNEAYLRATPAAQRVMEARDALFMLLSNAWVAEKGCYVRLDEHGCAALDETIHDRDINYATALLTETRMPVCHVCARGALAMTHFLRRGGEHDRQYLSIIEDAATEDANRDASAWTPTMLYRMEIAFEGWERSDCNGLPWYGAFPDEHERLLALFSNVVRNEGGFDIYDLRPFTNDVLLPTAGEGN